MTLEEAINMAAGHLPEGWDLQLCVERGAGWVHLYDEDGEIVDFSPSPDADLSEQVDAAVSHAISLTRS